MAGRYGDWGMAYTVYLCEEHRVHHRGMCPRCKREQEEKEANA